MTDVVAIYEAHAADLGARYDKVSSEALLAPVIDLLPPAPATVLDIGAGSGRDAAWFAGRGDSVTVAEPAQAFQAIIAARLPQVRIADARLPGLEGITGPFDLILASGVWHHLAEGERRAGFERIARLLAPGGRVILSLRHGPIAAGQPIHPLDAAAEADGARAAGLVLLRCRAAPSQQSGNEMAGVTWTWLALERTAS